MNRRDWTKSQKQRPLGNSEAHRECGCLLCKLGGGKTVYSTLTVTFQLNEKLRKLFSVIDLHTCYTWKDLTCPVTCRYHIGVTIGGA